MKNKKIIAVLLLSMVTGIARPGESGQAQSGVVVPTKVLVGGAAAATALTVGGLWYLKRRSDRLQAQIDKRNSEIKQEIREKQISTLRAGFYAFGDILGWMLGFTSGYSATAKAIARCLWFSSQKDKPESRQSSDLKESIDHTNFNIFSSQITSGGYDPNAIIDGEPVLHRIIKRAGVDRETRLKWVRCLAENESVQWDATDKKGFTALHYAVEQGDVKLVSLLREHGSRPDKGIARGEYAGLTALHYVAALDNDETRMAIAQDLLKASDVDLEVRSVQHGHTPLATAASMGRADLITLYLAHGASKEAEDKDGRGLLFHAVCSGDDSSVGRLLRGRSPLDCNSKDKRGDTPLCWAIRNKKYAVVKRLIAGLYSDLHLPGMDGKTPIQLLLDQSDKELLKIIEERMHVFGSYNGQSLFDAAVKNKSYASVQFLFDKVLTDEQREEVEETILRDAVRSGDAALVKALVSSECINLERAYDIDKDTMLHLAASYGQGKVYQVIYEAMLHKGLVVNGENGVGETPQQALNRVEISRAREADQTNSWYGRLFS